MACTTALEKTWAADFSFSFWQPEKIYIVAMKAPDHTFNIKM
jgi:tellurite resistance-related uncharacterized protein